MKPNLFIALEMDPDKPWNQVDFEHKLQEKRRAWSGQMTVSLLAEINLTHVNYFKQVASDEQKRQEQAKEASQLRKDELKARRQEFNDRLAWWSRKDHLWEEEFNFLVKEFRDILTETEIKRLIKVPLERSTPPNTKPSAPATEGSIMKDLGEKLKLLEVTTLYQFLEKFGGVDVSKATPTILQQISNEVYTNFTPMVTKDPIFRVGQELASKCRDIFKSDETRAKYDEALRLQRYDDLKKKIMWLGIAKRIEVVQFQALLEEAKRASHDVAEVQQLIINHATKNNWLIVSPETENIKNRVKKQQVCGYCHELNDMSVQNCNWCRKPLQSPCPKCSQICSSTERTCSKCSFPLGNRLYVEWLLHEAQNGDPVETGKRLTEAQAYWPASNSDSLAQKITTLLTQIETERNKQAKLRTQIETTIQQKRFYKAQTMLSQLQTILPVEVGKYKPTIEAEIRKVEAKLSQPLPADSEQRLLFYQTVQAMCHDALSNTIDQKIVELESQINEQKQEEANLWATKQQAETNLLKQMDSAFHQRRYYAARQLLPQAERLFPSKLSEYRRLVEANIKQAEESLARLNPTIMSDLPKQLEIYQQVQAICADAYGDTLAQKIKEIQTEISTLTTQQSKVTQQMGEAIKQNRWYEAQRLLPELARFNVSTIGEYRRQIESKIQQVETKLGQASGVDPEKTVALAREILQLCADCQPARELLTKTLPSPPINLQANVNGQIIQLTWSASPCREAKYIIMRKKQVRPTSTQDGEKIATVTAMEYDDKTAEVGVPTFYTVFADRDGIISKDTATLKQPILRLQEVLQLQSQIDNQRVQLSWQLPPNLHEVVVRRDTIKPPETIHAGHGVSVLQNREAIDLQVSDGQRYFYRIFAGFKNYNSQIVTTTGTVVEVTPTRPPQPIADLVITSIGITQPQLQLRWSTPAKGTVVLLKSPRSTQLLVGQTMSIADLNQHGELLSTPTNPLILSVNFDTYYVCPVILLDGMAYIGQEESYTLKRPSRLTLEYEVVKSSHGQQLRLIVCLGGGELPALRLVHNKDNRPKTKDDGSIILTLGHQPIKNPEFLFKLSNTAPGWVGLFLEDTTLYELIFIRRPNDEKVRV